MNPFRYGGLWLAALGLFAGSAQLFANPEALHSGVPVRMWLKAYSGDDADTEIAYVDEVVYLTVAPNSNKVTVSTINTGGIPYQVRRQVVTSTYVKASLSVSGAFLPWAIQPSASQPAAFSSGTVENSKTADTAGQLMEIDLGIVRVVPGRTYALSVGQTNLVNGNFVVSPPPGYVAVLNQMTRSACPLDSTITFRLVPASDRYAGLAGFATSAASSGLSWRLALGSLLNGDSAGFIDLADAGVAEDLSFLFTPGVLSYQAQSSEVFVHKEGGIMRQVIANQVAVDIVTLGENSNPNLNSTGPRYELRCYSTAQIQSYVPCSFSGDPFAVYRIERRRPDPNDATVVELQLTRESRNLPNFTTPNVPVARTDVMVVRRAGIAPGYHWSKTDWTQASQAALVATTIQSPASAPIITRHPQAQRVVAGETGTASVSVVGNPLPTYQWKKNGSTLAGKTAPTLTMANFQSGDAGTYTVTVTNATGSVTSSPADVALNTGGNAPFFVAQPESQAASPGRQILLEAIAGGAATISYQWKKNGTAISGATVAQLLLGNVQSADAADYTVTITNGSGSATSAVAAVSLLAARSESLVIETPGGATALRVSRSYSGLASGEELASETVGTTSPRISTFEYFTDVAQPGSFGYVKSIASNSGGWEAYDYYDTTQAHGYQIGQVQRRYRPFGNVATAPTRDSSKGEVTEFEYDVDAHGARTRQKATRGYIDGILVSRSEMSYAASTALGGGVAQTRRDFTGPGSPLSTVTHFYPENSLDAFVRGRVAAIDQADGIRKVTVHQRGTWNGSAFAPGNATSPASRITTITGASSGSQQGAPSNGSVTYYEGVSIPLTHLFTGKSMLEAAIRDERALVVRTESSVWTGTAWQLLAWVKFDYNPAGLLVSRVSSSGGTYTAAYDGLLKTSETDESGVTTGYLYDAAGRVTTVTRAGSGAVKSLASRKTYNASGQVLEERVGVGLAEQMVSAKSYDLAGRVVSETAPGLAPTTHAYDVVARIHTTTRPDGGTVIDVQQIDGKLVSRTGTAVVPEFFTYGIEPTSGEVWVQSNKGTATSRRWQRTYKDWAGREQVTVTPVFASSATTFDGNFAATTVRVARKYYNDTLAGPSRGKLVKTTDVGMAATLYAYDPLGRAFRSGLDATGDGTLNLASADRISESDQYAEFLESAWWMTAITRTYATAGSATSSVMSIKRLRLTGHAPGRLSETVETDVLGNVTRSITEVNRLTATTVTTVTTTGIGRPATETKVVGLTTAAVDHAGLSTAVLYDDLLRKWKVTDSRGNLSTTAYVAGTGHAASHTDDTGTIVSLKTYDTSGRVKSEAGAPDDARAGSPRHLTYSSYDLRGNMVRVWGDATVPVEYGHDPVFGDRTTMKTYRAGTGWEAATWPAPANTGDGDTTTWVFDQPTGLLVSKTDALNRAVTYNYTPRGQLATRTWARGVVSIYSYDSVTAEQREILYSDGTTPLRYTYNRMGQTTQIEDVTGLRTQEHCLCGKLLGEQLSAGFFGSRQLAYRLNQTAATSLGRTMGYALTAGAATEQDVSYGYDGATGRLGDLSTHTAFAAADHQFFYNYLAQSPMIENLIADSGSTFKVVRTFEADRDVLTSIDSQWNGVSRAKYNYTTDKLGQRTSRTQSGTAFGDYGDSVHQAYGYDPKGQLTNDTAYLGTAPVTANVLRDRRNEFAYDNIGNRLSSNVTGNATIKDDYVANALNQYVSRENNVLAVSGTSGPGVKVEVAGSGQLSSGPGRYWSALLTPPNVLGPWRGAVTIHSGNAGAGPGGTALVKTEARVAQLPKELQVFAYDLDGNLTSDGLWTYFWDAENRLVRMTTAAGAASAGFPNRTLEFRYDYLGRRVQKLVYDEANFQFIEGWRFVYQGWNLIAEYALNAQLSALSLVRSYTWGLDIVHDLAKSGGVGALVQIADHKSQKAYFPAYDGNGNVVALVNGAASGGSAGAPAAVYEYGPYGEPIRAQTLDPAIAEQPFRFSTKYTDRETGLVYYGRRYYDPSNGRFVGKDTIGERGGRNLYAFVRNRPVNMFDVLGMIPFDDLQDISMNGGGGGSDDPIKLPPFPVRDDRVKPWELWWEQSQLQIQVPPIQIMIPQFEIELPKVKIPCWALAANYASEIGNRISQTNASAADKQRFQNDLTQIITKGGDVGLAIAIELKNSNFSLAISWFSASQLPNNSPAGGRNSTRGELQLGSGSALYGLSGNQYGEDPNLGAIVLGHELGHAVLGISSEAANVELVENALRLALGDSNGARTTYSGQTLADKAKAENTDKNNPNKYDNDKATGASKINQNLQKAKEDCF